jgi:transcriptional regulator with XRE-family HTH domain
VVATRRDPRARQRFASALRKHLDLRGLTQDALAERLGTTQSSVSAWVTGRSLPSPQHIFALEEAFGVSQGTLAALVGFPVPHADDHRCDVVTAIEQNTTLSRAHKNLLLTMYASLIDLDSGRSTLAED